MPQLLIEFQTEEIPARMQARAETDLERLLLDRLAGAGFLPEGVKAFCGPRRLAAVVEGLPARQPDVREERKGPRVGAPDPAIQGFLRGAGLASLDQARVVEDKKGAYYVALIERPGRDTPDVIREILPDVAKSFPWPKSMRSQDQDFHWVRPLRRLVVAFDGEAVEGIEIGGVSSGRETVGHRVHGTGPFLVRRYDDYAASLRANRVLLDREERKAKILADARTLCQARNLELIEDAGLLEETAGLAEWPAVLMGEMDPAFLDLPGEVIRLTMRTHQKYFAVRDPGTGRLAPRFVLVANIEASDGGRVVAAGNARVLSARLSDARFFWEGDLKLPLDHESRRRKLEQLVFHQKLGSVWDKVERVAALARELAPACGADPDLAERAARLAKMDLATETVGEFPELQGQVGRELFLAQLSSPARGGGGPQGRRGETPSPPQSASRTAPPQAGEQKIAAAIEDHYRPLGPSDRVPSDPVAIAVALADKLDTLAGFWAIDEKPTGSSDPYALRRAALGVVRIVLEAKIRLRLSDAFSTGLASFWYRDWSASVTTSEERSLHDPPQATVDKHARALNELLAFLADRLKVQLREQGKRHDLVDAVFALGDDDLVRVVARVEALSAFLATEDGKNLLAGHKRAANILAAEEKKGKGLSQADIARGIDAARLVEPAEKALAAALQAAKPTALRAVEEERFADAMTALAGLRAPVDAFFDSVLVNAEDADLRRNRLVLLWAIRDALAAVADVSKIEG